MIEYTLLLAFVCLAAAAIFMPQGKNMGVIWSTANGITESAASLATTS